MFLERASAVLSAVEIFVTVDNEQIFLSSDEEEEGGRLGAVDGDGIFAEEVCPALKPGLRFGISVLGFRVWEFGSGIWGSRVRFRIEGVRFTGGVRLGFTGVVELGSRFRV